MSHNKDPSPESIKQPDLRSHRVLNPEERRHLTRFLSRHCGAGAFLDASTEGYGPLPQLMDRLIAEVVLTHQRLSQGTFVDAGERLDVHPQSLRVLARKVASREPKPGTLLTGTEPQTQIELWRAIVRAFLAGSKYLPEQDIAALVSPWSGPPDDTQLADALSSWLDEGWIRRDAQSRLRLTPTAAQIEHDRGTASLLAAHLVDHAAMYLATPMKDPQRPRLARLTHSRALLLPEQIEPLAQEVTRHLQSTLSKASTRWAAEDKPGEMVCITLLIGPSNRQNAIPSPPPARDAWLRAIARHIARHGGLREAMPVLYQEVARELRRRSTRRAYDPELLKAVGRARQNVHEWEAGRGYHFRGPAPVGTDEEGLDGLNASHLRQYSRVYLQEHSQRPCSMEEISASLEKDVGIRIDLPSLVTILDAEVEMGAARKSIAQGVPCYQAVRSFRRTWAQNVAQRRANLEMILKGASIIVASNTEERPNYHQFMAMVKVLPACTADFAEQVLTATADHHGQVLERIDNLVQDHENLVETEVTMILSPTIFSLHEEATRN